MREVSKMNCPNCRDVFLKSYLTSKGVEIDICSTCKGTWLGRGEILVFSKNPMKLEEALKESQEEGVPSEKLSPITGQKMVTFELEGTSIQLDYCVATGGLWLDDTEFTKLVNYSNEELSIEKPLVFFEQKPSRRPPLPSIKLPSLELHSVASVVGLYFILGLLLISVFEYFQISSMIAIYTVIGIFLFSALFSPWLMDFSITFFYSAYKKNVSELPKYLQGFIEDIATAHHMKIPTIYVIDDESPQAFTYGYTPNTARLVFSKGLYTLLIEEEVESVIAHEFGHMVHWDMALMTIIQLVPQVSYFIYKHTLEVTKNNKSSSSDNNKGSGHLMIIGAIAYAIYFLSHYVVLWFSRVREYHADRFSASYTKKPANLASALVKIGYCLALNQTSKASSMNALGIFDTSRVSSFAVMGYRLQNNPSKQGIEDAKEVMKWDFWNPWGSWYEFNSTHPLIAKRIQSLSLFSQSIGDKPFFELTEIPSESYWDEFAFDFFIYILPMLGIIPLLFGTFHSIFSHSPNETIHALPLALFIFGFGGLIKTYFTYREGYFPEKSIGTLLKTIKVSEVRPVPCTIKGKIIGKGIPGYIVSEDFILKDETGIIFLDYKQPIPLWEFLFGLFKAEKFIGQEVVVEGWYRRSPVPKIEISYIRTIDGLQESRTWFKSASIFSSVVLTIIGGIWLLGSF
jgi:heat shock protein HtpX